MYPATFASTVPERAALVMAGSGARVTYRELDDRSACLSGLFRDRGLRPGDTVLIALENDLHWAEVVWACLRSGLVLAAVNWHLTGAELAPMVADADPRAIVTSRTVRPALAEAVQAAGGSAPVWLVVGLGRDTADGALDLDSAVAATPRDPALPETTGGRVLFSSGTTGRPKAFRVPPTDRHPALGPVRSAALMRSLDFGDPPESHDVLLAAGPAYHAGPLGLFQSVHQLGGTVVMMERFDAESALAAIERRLRAHRDRAPRMAGAHPGSVGRATGSSVHIVDDAGRPLPTGEIGAVWFARPGAAEPVRADDGAADLTSTRGWGSAGDLGHVDADGYLYLSGRSGHTIISGGVNIYPREIEDVLTLHPDVDDVALIGVPEPEFGERVTAVVVPGASATPGAELAERLIDYCRERLAHFKRPRAVEFVEALPRSDAGKVRVGELHERFAPQTLVGGPTWS